MFVFNTGQVTCNLYWSQVHNHSNRVYPHVILDALSKFILLPVTIKTGLNLTFRNLASHI
jgi:hypothetical protein